MFSSSRKSSLSRPSRQLLLASGIALALIGGVANAQITAPVAPSTPIAPAIPIAPNTAPTTSVAPNTAPTVAPTTTVSPTVAVPPLPPTCSPLGKKKLVNLPPCTQ